MYLDIVLIICCLAIFAQDFKKRKIHVFLPILIFCMGYIKTNNIISITHILINMMFFILLFSLLFLYMSLKHKEFKNPFTNYFGLGDGLFYLALSPLFFTYYYLMFIVLSLLFSLILYIFLSKLQDEKTIPLAGYASIFFVIINLIHIFFPLSSYNIMQ